MKVLNIFANGVKDKYSLFLDFKNNIFSHFIVVYDGVPQQFGWGTLFLKKKFVLYR